MSSTLRQTGSATSMAMFLAVLVPFVIGSNHCLFTSAGAAPMACTALPGPRDATSSCCHGDTPASDVPQSQQSCCIQLAPLPAGPVLATGPADATLAVILEPVVTLMPCPVAGLCADQVEHPAEPPPDPSHLGRAPPLS